MASPVADARSRLSAANDARELGLQSCRQAVRAAGNAIRAMHRRQAGAAAASIADSEASLRKAQQVLRPHPSVAHAGFLHDAEKEYAESVLTRALIEGLPLPGPAEMDLGVPAWLNGLAEAASELRRHLLDLLRHDETDRAEELLGVMEDVYEALVTVDHPDAITGGLRRSADSLRAVLERTRSDVTATVVQLRLRVALERRYPENPATGV